jgi:hypothetical protein
LKKEAVERKLLQEAKAATVAAAADGALLTRDDWELGLGVRRTPRPLPAPRGAMTGAREESLTELRTAISEKQHHLGAALALPPMDRQPELIRLYLSDLKALRARHAALADSQLLLADPYRASHR